MKEEAQRLVERFGKAIDDDYSEWLEEAKQCAKICVEEIMKWKIHFLGITGDNENILIKKIKEEHEQLIKEIDKL